MLDRQFIKQHGLKSIAVDCTALDKSLSKYVLPLFFGIFFVMKFQELTPSEVVTMLVLFAIGIFYFITLSKNHADEVWETIDGFIIVIGQKYEKILFSDLEQVKYHTNWFLDNKNPIVTFYFKKPNQFGKKVYFVTWEDASNFKTAWTKNPVTESYIHSLQEKIK
ncbi:Uncharacterised protein [Moraxella lacunata]|uniref:Uncharacterized protein n=1 Tax=Moraxella lacunata TaxID=477 RepID=A0A378TSR7_MORLA|nr:hypothetical protein [Moraxella lacunata]STZ63691.1 Uncharacterised protein [Moraxella lacunata]